MEEKEKENLKKLEIIANKSKSKTFLLKKLNKSNSQINIIKSKISDFFLSPDRFLDQNPKIFINRKINIKKIIPIDLKQSLQKTFGKKDTSSFKNNSTKLSNLKEKGISTNNVNIMSTEEKDIISKNFEVIDKEKLKSIFNSYKILNQTRNKSNKILTNEENKETIKKYDSEIYDSNNIPSAITSYLDIQNRRLINKNNLDKKSRETSKYLSRKIHKKENDLLFNSIHLYRFKKEILGKSENIKDNYNSVNNLQSNLFKWISSLRRPNNFLGKRESYINVSSDNNNPLWSIVVEKYPITKEISIKSGYDLDNQEYKEFIKKQNMDSDKIKNLENLDTIGIQGKKLYDLEYEREMSSNNSKLLHKVFIDNGKVIMYKDVNNIFGHETIYKNYNSNNSSFKQKLNKDLIFGNRSMKDISFNRINF